MPLAPPSAPAKSYLVSFTPDRSRTTSLPAKKPLERRSQPSNSPSHSVMGSSGVSARQERATAKTKRVPRLSYARHAPSHDWSAKSTVVIPARVSDSHLRGAPVEKGPPAPGVSGQSSPLSAPPTARFERIRPNFKRVLDADTPAYCLTPDQIPSFVPGKFYRGGLT